MNLAKKLFVTLRGVARHPVNRQSPMSAMWRFCTTQVAARRIPGDVCVHFPANTCLVVPAHMKGSAHFIDPGLCEFEEMGFVLHFLRPSDLFVDVGANIGAFTTLASGVCGAQTIAFEPHDVTYQFLRRNIAINDIASKARAIHCAIGSRTGELQLTRGLGTENYVSTGQEDAITVPCHRLDDELKGMAPKLIKVDVEGYESDVVAGAKETLRNPALEAMIVERSGIGSRYGFNEDAVHQEIRNAKFSPFQYDPLSRELRSISNEQHGNIIYLRDAETALKRLREAPKVRFRSVTF